MTRIRNLTREQHIEGLAKTVNAFAKDVQVNIQFIHIDQLAQIGAEALLGDFQSARIIRFLEKMLDDAGQHKLPCFLCGKLLRNWPLMMVMTGDEKNSGAIGGVVGHCCEADQAIMITKVLDVLNKTLKGGGMFKLWQGHEPGHG